jgi:hypothetical protein
MACPRGTAAASEGGGLCVPSEIAAFRSPCGTVDATAMHVMTTIAAIATRGALCARTPSIARARLESGSDEPATPTGPSFGADESAGPTGRGWETG